MLNSLAGAINTELGSNLGDNGESLAHNRIVPSKEAEATFLFSELISTENTALRCPRNGTAFSLSVLIHSLTVASLVAAATNSPSGSKAARQTTPDVASPNKETVFSSTLHNAMCGLGI